MLIKEIREGMWKASGLPDFHPLCWSLCPDSRRNHQVLLSGEGPLLLEEDEEERRVRRRGGAPWCGARAAGSAGAARGTNARDSSRWEPLAELAALLPLEGLRAATALQLPWDPHGRQTRK